MTSCFYTLLPSAFGNLGLVWQETETGPKVHRVVLPNEHAQVETGILQTLNEAGPVIARLAGRLQSFLEGEDVEFELDVVALEQCSAFQQRVLLAEHRIPRGWISTYGRIAWFLDIPGAARAVGGALAQNPFPIIIPCHRAVRSNGELGGFRGGLKMKRALLELEGLKFSPDGRVQTRRVYY
jgi:methylated-DNA-[protein]-cysteine S-methyltransferase